MSEERILGKFFLREMSAALARSRNLACGKNPGPFIREDPEAISFVGRGR